MVGLEKIIKFALQKKKAKYGSFYYTSELHRLEITGQTVDERAPDAVITVSVSTATPFHLLEMGLLGDGLGLHTTSSTVPHSVPPTVSLGGWRRSHAFETARRELAQMDSGASLG